MSDTVKTAKRQVIPVVRRLFLSCVSHEFRSYRDELAANLAQPGVEIRRQEDFVNAGGTTLEKLNSYIESCDAVIHLIGSGTGAYPAPRECDELLKALPDFESRTGLGDFMKPPGLSFTQWEAWLAIYHKKAVAFYVAAEGAFRDTGFRPEPQQQERQKQHLRLLESMGRDRKEFVSPHALSIDVLRALPLLVPGFAENIRRGEFRDRNLLFAVLAMQDGILSRDQFTKVCTLWATDTDRPIVEIMRSEGLLSADDESLLEARLTRKLKSHGGDIRQSLAENLGSDARESLSEVFDSSVVASLPQKLASIASLSENGWRYKLTRTHASGGLGVVSVAEDTTLERTVAVKQMRTERLLDPFAIERFAREARITGQLQHPNIVPVYELGLTPEDQVPFYAMRFVGHRTLHDEIVRYYGDKATASEKNVRFRELLQSFQAVCNAVAYAHDQGIIHRDIKPANIMVGDFGEVILLDWGLAKRIDAPEPLLNRPLGGTAFGMATTAAMAPEASPASLESTEDLGQTQAGVRLGSPAYMAPEQASGRIDLHGPATDIYGLGATLYEVLTGDVPYQGTSIEELLTEIQSAPIPNARKQNPNVSAALAAICAKALAKEQSDRYATAGLLGEDIQRWLSDEPVSAHRETVTARSQRLVRKNPGPVSGLAAAVLVGLFGSGIGLYFVNAEKNNTRAALVRENALRVESEVQKTKAIESSELAAKRFEEKRVALDEMLATFSDEGLKVIAGSQPIRKRFLEEGISQYLGMLSDRGGELPVLLQSANSYRELGTVNAELGDGEASLASLQKAVELCREAIRVKDEPATLEALGDALYDLGQAHISLKGMRGVEALKPLAEEGRAIFESLHKADPESPNDKHKLGRAMILQGLVMASPWTEGKDAVRLLREAHAADPDNARLISNLGRGINNYATVEFNDNDTEAKLQRHLEAAKLQDRALAMEPTYAFANYLRSILLGNARTELLKLGRVDDAIKLLNDAIAMSREFVKQNPAIPAGRKSLGNLLKDRAVVLTRLTRIDDACATYEEAIQVYQDLQAVQPHDPENVESTIQALLDLADLKSDLQKAEIYARITIQAEDAMRRHDKSDSLLGKFVRAYGLQGEKLFSIQRLGEAQQAYEAGIALYKKYFEKVSELSEASRGQFVTLIINGLVRIHNEQKQFEQSLQVGESLLAIVPFESLEWSDYQDGYLECRGQLSFAYEELKQYDKAVAIRTEVRDTAQKLTGGDPANNWYIAQRAFGAHLHIVRAARLGGNDAAEFRSMRDFLRETQPYVANQSHEAVLAETQEFTKENLAKLRKTYDAYVDKGGMKRFTVPVDFGGVTGQFNIYVAETWPFFEDQIRWVENVRGGKFPDAVRDAFRNLFEIARNNNVSFQDLVVYALGTAANSVSGTSAVVRSTPIVFASPGDEANEDAIAKTRKLTILRQQLVTSGGDLPTSQTLLVQYIERVERMIAENKLFAAGQFLGDAQQFMDLLTSRFDEEDLASQRQYLTLINAANDAASAKYQKAYDALVKLVCEPITDHPHIREGAAHYAIGWTCEKLNRPTEAATWYLSAATAEHPLSLQAVFEIGEQHPEVKLHVPQALQEAWNAAKANTDDSKTAMTRFVELASTRLEQNEGSHVNPRNNLLSLDQLDELANGFHELGIALEDATKYEEASKYLLKEADLRNKQLGLSKDDPEAKKAAGNCYFENAILLARTGQRQASIDWLKRAASLEHVDANLQLSRVYTKGELVKQDLALARECEVTGRLARAASAMSRGEYTEALADFDAAQKLKPHDDPIVQARIATCCRKLMQWDRAIKEYNVAIEMNPTAGDIRIGLLATLLYGQRPEQVLEVLLNQKFVDWRTKWNEADRVQYEPFVSLIESIALILLNRDASEAEARIRQHAETSTAALADWSWEETEAWLERSAIESEKQSKIVKLMTQLKSRPSRSGS